MIMFAAIAFILALWAVVLLDWLIRSAYELHRAQQARQFDRWLKEHPEV